VYSKYLFILPTGFIFYIGFSQGVPAFSLPLAMCHHRLVVLSYFSVVGACSFTQQCPQKPTDNERRVNWIVFTLWDQEDTGLRVVSGLLFRPCSLRGKSFRTTCCKPASQLFHLNPSLSGCSLKYPSKCSGHVFRFQSEE